MNKCEGRELHLLVDGKVIKETSSDKLLGIIMNNRMNWSDHLHGETWRSEEKNQPVLIPQLSQILGILRKISKLSYCLKQLGLRPLQRSWDKIHQLHQGR